MKTIQLSDKAYKEMVKTLRRSREVLTMMRDSLELNVKLKNKLEERDHAIEELKNEIVEKDARISRLEDVGKFDRLGYHQATKTLTELRFENIRLKRAIEFIYNENKQSSTPKDWIYHVSKEEYMEHLKQLIKKEEESGRKREETAGED